MFLFYFDRRWHDYDFISPWAFRPVHTPKITEKGLRRRVKKRLVKRKILNATLVSSDTIIREAQETEALISKMRELEVMRAELSALQDYSRALYRAYQQQLEDEELLVLLLL